MKNPIKLLAPILLLLAVLVPSAWAVVPGDSGWVTVITPFPLFTCSSWEGHVFTDTVNGCRVTGRLTGCKPIFFDGIWNCRCLATALTVEGTGCGELDINSDFDVQ